MIQTSNQSPGRVVPACPNCRGPPHLIAVWPFVAPISTQIGANGTEVRNDYLPPSPRAEPEVSDHDEIDGEDDEAAEPEEEEDAGASYYSSDHFHIASQLPDGRLCITIDPGSVGNLGGDRVARQVAIASSRKGLKPSYERRARPLKVSGVGHGTQECVFD